MHSKVSRLLLATSITSHEHHSLFCPICQLNGWSDKTVQTCHAIEMPAQIWCERQQWTSTNLHITYSYNNIRMQHDFECRYYTVKIPTLCWRLKLIFQLVRYFQWYDIYGVCTRNNGTSVLSYNHVTLTLILIIWSVKPMQYAILQNATWFNSDQWLSKF